MKKAALLVIGLVVVGMCLVLVFAGGSSNEYDSCISDCLDAVRGANIERDDITDADYQIIMAEHKNYICPGKCEQYK